MKVGNWELSSVLAGRFGLDGGAMFGVVPKVLWARLLPPDDANRIPMVMRLLVARGHGRTVLVDVGAGEGYGEKYEKIYAFEDNVHLHEALARSGVEPGAITDVLLTHLHFDHGAGVVGPDGDGWKLLFPGARHHVQRSQWEHALSPNARDRASYFEDRLRVMEAQGVLDLHDGPWTLAPGFDLLVFDGHTPGQQLPLVSGDGANLFYTGDLVPTRHHIPSPYVMAYDLDPILTMREKEPLVERAANEDWIFFFEHDAHLGACHLRSEGGRVVTGEEVRI